MYRYKVKYQSIVFRRSLKYEWDTCDDVNEWTRYFIVTLFDYVIDEAHHQWGACSKDSCPQTNSSSIKGSEGLSIVIIHVTAAFIIFLFLGPLCIWSTRLIIMALGENVLVLLDILFSLFFVGPFTILYWRGTFVTIYNFFISGMIRYKILSILTLSILLQVSLPQRSGFLPLCCMELGCAWRYSLISWSIFSKKRSHPEALWYKV